MQERPKFRHRVLNGCAGEKESVATLELQQHLPALGRRGFDGLGLVQDQVLPLDPVEILEISYDELIARDHNVERCTLRVQVLLVPEVSENLPLRGRAPVRDYLKIGDEFLHFLLPVVEGGGRGYDQERPPNIWRIKKSL